VLLDTMYDLPSRTDVARVVIDSSVVEERVLPTLIPITELGKEREEREERSA
jgi:ATP-dependent Clp protease ATP-binding subunit ClpX